MEMEGSSKKEGVTFKRAEIDTAAPFRSVREAVTMFGDIPVGGQRPYSSKVKMGINRKLLGSDRNYEDLWELDLDAELEETKYRLQKAREERLVMENRLCSLQQELERTKTELQLLKHTGAGQNKLKADGIIGNNGNYHDDDEVDDEMDSVEIVEDSARVQYSEEGRNTSNIHYNIMQLVISRDDHREEEEEEEEEEDENKKIDMMMMMMMMNGKVDEMMASSKRYDDVNGRISSRVLGEGMFVPQVRFLERHPSLRRKKKKGLIPLIGAFFSKTNTKTDHIHTTAAHEVP